MAWASMGSPSTVPVPCASTTSTSWGSSPALASARRMTRCWAGPLGAVSPLEAPSWLTAVPRTSAQTRCPLRRASDSRSSTSTPAPSDQPTPSARAENDLQRPSLALAGNPAKNSGVAMTVTPAASARPHSPARSAWHARCSATSDDEQAVSSVTAGPSRPSTYARRPETTLLANPVRAKSLGAWPPRPESMKPM
jgi:hypothetical protein